MSSAAVALALGTLCLAAEEAKPDLGTVIGIDLGTTCASPPSVAHKLHDAMWSFRVSTCAIVSLVMPMSRIIVSPT